MQPTSRQQAGNNKSSKPPVVDDAVRDIIRTHAQQTLGPIALLSGAKPDNPSHTVPSVPPKPPVPPVPVDTRSTLNNDVSVQTSPLMMAIPVSKSAVVLNRLKRALEALDR